MQEGFGSDAASSPERLFPDSIRSVCDRAQEENNRHGFSQNLLKLQKQRKRDENHGNLLLTNSELLGFGHFPGDCCVL